MKSFDQRIKPTVLRWRSKQRLILALTVGEIWGAEQACSFLNTWVDPRYIFLAVLMLISSGLFPFLMHKYKLAREREEKLFDTRKEEYQCYFKKMEEAARLAGQDYDHFLTHTYPWPHASCRIKFIS